MHDRSYNRIVVGKLKNFHYESDIKYTLEMCQWVLKPIGMWSLIYNRTSKLEKVTSVVLLITCFCSLFFIIVPSGHYIFFVEKNIQTKVKLLGPVGFCLSSAIKYCYLSLKGAVFGRCIAHVEKDWRMVNNPNDRIIMLKYASISRNLIALCAIFLYSGGMSYHTVMQFLSKDRINSTVKPLTYPGYDAFFDIQSSPSYEIVFSIHCLSAMVMYSVTTAAYSLAAICVTHICGQIRIQISRLDNLIKSEQKKDNRHDPLADIIRDHVEILSLSKNTEEALREICFMEILESTMAICLLEYYCLVEWENSDVVAILTYFILLVSFTFNILIFCYIGEVLSEECSQISPAAYDIEWYDLPAKKASGLILVNAISLYPPKLTAGKIVDLSLNTFTIVMKSSVIYLNLLRTVTDW
ncbi:odorant receptor 4-like [Hylaeus anthracinus]|uniref:odorant receptor 4-like n=1 Tax=Hylaeus anthracinus TaxID=313031 RepID=UPI0023B8F5FB|nr:odorant receptor 4-like [Hylaeus anthracinus]